MLYGLKVYWNTFVVFLICLVIGYYFWGNYPVNDKDKRFVVTYEQKQGFEIIKVISDRETGINYLYVKDGFGSGVAVMDLRGEVVKGVKDLITGGKK